MHSGFHMKKNMPDEPHAPGNIDIVKSRSQVKREMTALQKTGERLATLSAEQINAISMPDDLREAVLSAKKIKSRGARKRQFQFIGALMRKIDVDPINRALHEIDRGRCVKDSDFHMIEKWRDGLVNGLDTPIGEIMEKFPGAESGKIRQLVRNAKKELSEGMPPKSARALFRYIKKLADDEIR